MAKAPTDSEELWRQFWKMHSNEYDESIDHALKLGLRVRTVNYLQVQKPQQPEDPSTYVYNDADVIFVDCLIDADRILKIANSNEGKFVIVVMAKNFPFDAVQWKNGWTIADVLLGKGFKMKEEHFNEELDKFKLYFDNKPKETKKYGNCAVLITEDDISDVLNAAYDKKIYNYNPETGWKDYNEQQLVFTNKFDDVKDKMDLFDKEGTIVLVASKKNVEIPGQIPRKVMNISTTANYNAFFCSLMKDFNPKNELKRVMSKKSEEKKKEEKKVEESKPKSNFPIDIRLVRIRHNPIKKS